MKTNLNFVNVCKDGTICVDMFGMQAKFLSSVKIENSEEILLQEPTNIDRTENLVLATYEYAKNNLVITQDFRYKNNGVEISINVQGEEEIAVEKIYPLIMSEAINLEDINFLSIPFDNDDWARYSEEKFNCARESYDIACLDNSKEYIVVAAVTYDNFKTAIIPEDNKLKVVCGYTSDLTRDTLKHGSVLGKNVKSETIFITFAASKNEAYENFSISNLQHNSIMHYDNRMPYGWNSFSRFPSDVTTENFFDSASYFSKLSNRLENNEIFINYDFAPISIEDYKKSKKYTNDVGVNAGFYSAPFVIFEDINKLPITDKDRIESIMMNTIDDIQQLLLKDSDGNVLPSVDGLLSLDATHPETLKWAKKRITTYLRLGYKYIKLDFLGHAHREGCFYDKRFTTGRQVLNYAMNEIISFIPEDVFISISISSMFPNSFGHARRISCDCFGTKDDTLYLLNSVYYGSYLQKKVYQYNDADHVVLLKSFKHENTQFYEAKARFLASIVCGSIMLFSDDYGDENVKSRFETLTAPSHIDILAVNDEPFEAFDEYTYYKKFENQVYLIMFNLQDDKKIQSIDMKSIGLEEEKKYTFYEVYDEYRQHCINSLEITFEPNSTKFFVVYA